VSIKNRGATSSSFQGGGNFHEISFDDVIVLIQPWHNFLQTVTYNNNVFLPADTKYIVQTHTFCTTLVNKNRQN